MVTTNFVHSCENHPQLKSGPLKTRKETATIFPKMKVAKSPDDAAARTNCVFVSPVDFNAQTKYIVLADRCPMNIKFLINNVRIDQRIMPGDIGTTLFQRKFASVSVNQDINVRVFNPEAEGCFFLSTLTLSVNFVLTLGDISEQDSV